VALVRQGKRGKTCYVARALASRLKEQSDRDCRVGDIAGTSPGLYADFCFRAVLRVCSSSGLSPTAGAPSRCVGSVSVRGEVLVTVGPPSWWLTFVWLCEPAFAEWLAPRLLGVDLIHAHMLGAWWATASVAVGSVPLIASEHYGYEWNQEPPWAVMADVAERIDLFYAHGPDTRAGALRVGIPGDRIRRGVSPVVGMDASPRPGLPSPRIMFTGRLSPYKAPDVSIDAVARMASPPPVMVLGTGAMHDHLRAQVVCGWGCSARLRSTAG
jgi:glycosyltransferase involved in cell wall biosynthesis